MGVTRLSLGVENFNDRILEENGRAHLSKEIYRVLPWIREQNFDQLNVDLIAGMVGETEDNWKACYEKAASMAPESVTIYQLEVPYNTTLYREMRDGRKLKAPIADQCHTTGETLGVYTSDIGYSQFIKGGVHPRIKL